MSPATCVYCGSADYEERCRQTDLRFAPEREFQVCRCRSCGILFTLPRLGLHELARHYPETYGAYVDGAKIDAIFEAARRRTAQPSQARARALAQERNYARGLREEILRRGPARARAALANAPRRLRRDLSRQPKRYAYALPFRAPGARVLHLGSGDPAVLATHAIEHGLEVHQLDIQRPVCEALARNGIRARASTVLETSHPEGSFDVIFSSHVLEHLLAPREELARLVSWLADEGILVCGIPVYDALEWSLGPTYFDVPRHQTHPTKRSAAMMFREAGLRIRKLLFPPYGWGFAQNRFRRSLEAGRFDPAAFDRPLDPRDYWASFALSRLRQSGSALYYLTKG